MKQVNFVNDQLQEKAAYQFPREEFKAMRAGMFLSGVHLGVLKLVASSDVSLGLRPRVKPFREEIDTLQSKFGDIAPVPSIFDSIRDDRAEIMRALRCEESGLAQEPGAVYLGLFTTALCFNQLRPFMSSEREFPGADLVKENLDQFYNDGQARLEQQVYTSN